MQKMLISVLNFVSVAKPQYILGQIISLWDASESVK